MRQGAFKRGLIWFHKWFGVVLALFFAMWFSSGIVLHFVPFPDLTESERLAASPPLPAACPSCLSADQAARRAGLTIQEARLGVQGDTPVWRVLVQLGANSAPRWRRLDARSGTLLPPLDETGAAAVAEAFSGRPVRHTERLQRDQWTVPQGLNPYRPLVKVSLGTGTDGKDDGLELYVSTGAGEVIRDTRRRERVWNWLGAVPHWLYPTVLRQFPAAWHEVVVWISVPAVLVALSGILVGIWQLFLNPRRRIPYRTFWLRWHHILGLTAAVFTFTWMLSGLLSMNPFDVFGPRGFSTMERQAWAGPPAKTSLPVNEALARAARWDWAPREMHNVRVNGRVWYRFRDAHRQRLMPASADAAGTKALPDALIKEALANLRTGRPAPHLIRVDHYDGLYYARRPNTSEARWHRPLPVWRADWPDGVSAYADPGSGQLRLRVDQRGRWQRLLYQGLHTLDFAPLLARPALRTGLVVGLSLVGLALCLTSCVVAWQLLRRRRGRGARRSRRARLKVNRGA